MRDATLSGKPSMPCAWSAQVHGKVRPLQPSLWSRILPWIVCDETWEPFYRSAVQLVALVCLPVFAAVAAVLVFGGS